MNSSIIIEGNTVENGNYYSAGVSTYGYTTLMLIKGDSLISNNLFAAANTTGLDIQANSKISGNSFTNITTGGSSNFIKLTNCVCKVTNNKMVRGASTVQSYVYITGTSGHVITDNDFDSTTVDGSSEVLVANPTLSDVMDSNSNQIYYRLLNFAAAGEGYSIDPTYVVQTISFGYTQTQFKNLTGGNNDAPSIFYSFNLTEMMPMGARIVGVDWSYRGLGATFHTTGATQFTLSITRTNSLDANITAGTGSIAGIILDLDFFYMDPVDRIDVTAGYSNAGQYTTLTDATVKHMKIDIGNSSVYQITPNRDVVISMNMGATTLANATSIIRHALLIKYKCG